MAEHGHQSSSDTGYELSDIQVKAIVLSGVAVVILTAGAYLFGIFFAKYFVARDPITRYEQLPVAEESGPMTYPTGPRLQVEPERALTQLEERQRRMAQEYAVLSDSPEIYRIPVEVAIDLVAESGMPAFAPLAETQQQQTGTP